MLSISEFAQLDYKQLFLNPFIVPIKKSPYEHYSTYREYKEFNPSNTPHLTAASHNKVLRYIPLVYGQKSPLNKELTDIKKIKAVAAELAGFKRDWDGRFTKEMHHILAGRDKSVNSMIIRYIMLHKSAKYTEHCILRDAYFKLGEKIVEDPSPKDLVNFREVGSQLGETTQFLLGGDTNPVLEEALEDYYLADRLRLRPEDIAKNKKEGKPIF